MATERRKLILGASWTLASTLVALVVGAILNPVLVLYLGIGGYGIWASAIAIASLFALGGDLGVSGALTKFVAERRGQGRSIESLAGSALSIGFLAGGASGVALATTSVFVQDYVNYPQFSILLQILAAQMPFNLGVASLMAILQGNRRFRPLALFGIAQSFGILLGSVGLLILGFGLPGVMAASFATSLVLFAALAFFARADLRYPSTVGFRSDFRTLAPFGIRLAATNGFSTILYQIDVVALSLLIRDPVVVGAYALAVFITRGLWILPTSISATTYPVISEYAATNEDDRISRYLSTALAASLALTGILTLAIILFGRPILLLVFGPNAVSSYDYALLLLFGTASLGSLRAVAPALPAVGRPNIGLGVSCVGAALLVVLAFAMTSHWGATGASLAVSITFTLVAALLVVTIDRFVLASKIGLLSSRRITWTALVAFLSSIAAISLALPTSISLGNSIVGILLIGGVAAILLKVSGGKETWGGFFWASDSVSFERG